MQQEPLLTRDQFREAVFARDNYTCVFCQNRAVDAHHILERRLWSDGGYYLSNGASVCEKHHMMCETTEISTQQVREICGITKIILPEHLYDDQEYDKWGNPILPNGMRLRGELFYDESVQKVLKDVLHLFTEQVKYPRTYHLPWSEGMNDDDKMHKTISQWEGHEVICTEKMDGENTTMYKNYIHARSIDSRNHPSRNRVKGIWGSICGDIPDGWRVIVENLYARHSIVYYDLKSYAYGLSIWNEKNFCLNYDETVEWFQLFDIPTPKVLYRGIFDVDAIKKIYNSTLMWNTCEGYVLRPVAGFAYSDFRKVVGKFVRKNHVMTTKHWMQGQEIIPNHLLTKDNE